MNILKNKLGIKLELEIVNSIGERIGQSYISQLFDVIDDYTVVIAAPIHESRLMLITPGTKIRVIFLDDRQGLLCFHGSVESREKRENLICLRIIFDGKFEKIQRRNYYRLECYLNLTYSALNAVPDSESIEKLVPGPVKKAVSKNLSGNGACIVIDEELPKGSLIELNVELCKNVSIKAVSKVIRCTLLEGLNVKKYEAGLYFVKITQKDQDTLIKYIFDQQRLLLKNTIPDRS